MVMHAKFFCIVLFTVISAIAAPSGGFYANVSEELLISPSSAAMGGAVLSNGNGTTVESSPGNLPFDSLSRLSLAYAGFYNNAFSSSMLTYSGKPLENLGFSLMAGYIYIPDIVDTRGSTSNDSGELIEAKESYFSASKIVFRAAVGRSFTVSPKITLGAGIAVNAKRSRLPETGYGIGCDAGISALFPGTGLSVALLVENLTSSYIYWNESFQERSYPHPRAGFGWYRNLPYIYGSLRLSYSSPDLLANEGINTYAKEITDNENVIETPGVSEIYDKPSHLVTRGKFGLEYSIMNTVALRIGYSGYRFGFGGGVYLLGGRAGIDFAYLMHAMAGTYQLSAQYAW